jgi:hypothetical protein
LKEVIANEKVEEYQQFLLDSLENEHLGRWALAQKPWTREQGFAMRMARLTPRCGWHPST